MKIIPIDFSKLLALAQANSFSIIFYEFFRDLRPYLLSDFKRPFLLSHVLKQVASPNGKAVINAIQNGTLVVSKDKYKTIISIVRPKIQVELQTFFDSLSLDGIIFPTTRLTARPIGQEPVMINGQPEPTRNAYTTFETFGSIAGVPGISIPIGLTNDTKLPVGMEIEGAYGRDEKLLSVGAALMSALKPLPKPTDVDFEE